MILVGVFGCAIAISVAVLAVLATMKPQGGCCSVYFYSCFAGSFTLVFMGLGIVFLFVGILIHSGVNDPNMAVVNDCQATLLKDISLGDTIGVCAVDTTCTAVNSLKGDLEVVGFGLGIPFLVGSMCMYIGCWACCCCKSHFIDAPGALAQEHMAHAQHHVVPAGVYASPVPPKTQQYAGLDHQFSIPNMPPVSFYHEPAPMQAVPSEYGYNTVQAPYEQHMQPQAYEPQGYGMETGYGGYGGYEMDPGYPQDHGYPQMAAGYPQFSPAPTYGMDAGYVQGAPGWAPPPRGSLPPQMQPPNYMPHQSTPYAM